MVTYREFNRQIAMKRSLPILIKHEFITTKGARLVDYQVNAILEERK